MKKQFISCILVLAVVGSSIPSYALAATVSATTNSVTVTGTTATVDLGDSIGNIDITIPYGKPYTVSVSFTKVNFESGKYYIKTYVGSTDCGSYGRTGPNGSYISKTLSLRTFTTIITSAKGDQYRVASDGEIPAKLIKDGIKSISILDAKAVHNYEHTLYDSNGYVNREDRDSTDVSGTYSGSKILDNTVYIKMVELTIDDYLGNVKANATDIPNQNGLTQAQIISYLTNGVDTSKVAVTLSNYNYKVATDNVSGGYTGIITVSKAGETQTFNLNVVIPQLAQTASSASNIITASLKNLKITNNTTTNDIINAMKLGVSDLVSIKFGTVSGEMFTKVNSNETTVGSIKGKIYISDGSVTLPVQVDLEIDRLSQSVNNVYENFSNVIGSLNASNNTTAEDIKNLIKVSNSDIKITVSNFKRVDASDLIEGNLTCTVTITDGYVTKQLPINLKISKLAQISMTAKNKIQNSLDNIKVTNTTANEDILKAIKVGVDTSVVNVAIEDFKLIESSETAKGVATGIIKINDGTTEETINMNLAVEQLEQSIDTVAELYKSYLKSMNATNETSIKSILNSVLITNEKIKANLVGFNKIEATETTSGTIVGKIEVTTGTETRVIPVDLTIRQLPQSVGTLKALYEKSLEKFVVTNNTVEEDILAGVYKANSNLTVYMDNFKKVAASDTAEGLVTGNIVITDGTTTEVVPVKMSIKLLTQELGTAVRLVQNTINTFNPDNASNFDKLLLNCNKIVTNPNIDVYYLIGGPTEKIAATEFKDGYLKATMVVTDRTTQVEVPVDLVIQKLPQTVGGANQSILAYLVNLKVTNDTTEQDLTNAVKTNITNDCISIAFGKDSVDKFNKVQSNEFKDGKIKGTIYVTDDENTIKIPVNLNIEKLPQTLAGAKESINIILPNLKANNNTEKQDIIDQIKPFITEPNIKIDIDNFNKVKADNKTEGKITGTIVLSNTTDKEELTLDVTIVKLNQTLDEAKNTVEITLPNIKVDNDTTKEDMEKDLQDKVGDNIGIKVENDFNKELATSKDEGKITGTVTIINKDDGTSTQVEIELPIAKLPQSVEDVKNDMSNILDGIKGTNTTTEKDILDAINEVIKNPNITVGFKPEDPFKNNNSTTVSNGAITGTLVVSDGTNIIELGINISIEKLPNTSLNTLKGGSSSGSSSSSSSSSSSENTKNISEEQLSQILKNSDVSILGISRDKLLSNVTMDIVNTTTENNNIAFEGINSEITKVDFPYTEIKATDGKQTNGALSVLMADNNVIGMSIQGKENYGENTDIMVSTKLSQEDLNTYTKVKYIDKYVEVKDKSIDTTDGMIIQGINSDNYLITTKPILETKLANNGWYKNDNREWVYIDNYDTEKGWIYDNGWYYNDLNTGKMQTGWIQNDDGTWYYLNKDSDGTQGKMQTGWTKSSNDNWYYLYSDGKMAQETYIDGYYVDETGALVER